MPRKLKLTIAYDGTDFHGWQRQLDLRTVQQVVEDVTRRVLGEPLNLVGASRTDSGVHARGQVAHIVSQSPMPTENVRRAINHRLPADVTLVHIRAVADTFHATRDARGKLYRYTVYNAPEPPADPTRGRYAWHVRFPLCVQRLRSAAKLMIGTHDFAGFASQGSPRDSTVRTIHGVTIRRVGREILIDVRGDGFLYNQVRNMVGTLYEIGRGHWAPQRVTEILTAADRTLAGPTAPACGLCLQWVRYPPDAARPASSESD